jgi:DNA-binding response OmpR family regulator
MPLANLWIVSRDRPATDTWERLLRRQGWTVHLLEDPAKLAHRARELFGLALIDWNCLQPDPAAALAALKAKTPRMSLILCFRTPPPIEFVAAALEAGADDHLPYAMAPELFVAKIKTHLRRLLPSMTAISSVLKSPRGDLRLDRTRRQLFTRGADGNWNEFEGLTRTEMEILALLLQTPGAALERREMIEALWPGKELIIRPGTVDKHVEALRRKLGPSLGARIKTVYGVGYAYKEGDRR